MTRAGNATRTGREQQLQKMGITDAQVRLQPVAPDHPLLGYEKLKPL
jgi:hypothetical protein